MKWKRAGEILHTTDGIDFIKEDNARLLGARHLEQLANHARAFTDIPALSEREKKAKTRKSSEGMSMNNS